MNNLDNKINPVISKRVLFNIDYDLHRKLKIYCAENDTTITDVLIDYIKKVVKK